LTETACKKPRLDRTIQFYTERRQEEQPAMKRATPQEAITPAEYRAFQEAYDFL
jgi:hypothetical protein